MMVKLMKISYQMSESKEQYRLPLRLKTFPKIYWQMCYQERKLKKIQNLKGRQMNKRKLPC